MATKFFKKNGVDSFTMYLLFGDHCWKSSKVGCVFFLQFQMYGLRLVEVV